MFPYFPANRLQKLRGMSKSTVAPTLKFSIFPGYMKYTHKTKIRLIEEHKSTFSISIYRMWDQQQIQLCYRPLSRNL